MMHRDAAAQFIEIDMRLKHAERGGQLAIIARQQPSFDATDLHRRRKGVGRHLQNRHLRAAQTFD